MNPTTRRWSDIVPLLAAAAVLAIAYATKSLLVPACIALLVAFVLAPLVRRMDRLGLPHAANCFVVTFLAAGLTAGAIFLISAQILHLTARLPDYRENLENKLQSLRPATVAPVARLQQTVSDLRRDIATTAPATQASRAAAPTTAPPPVPVQIIDGGPDPLAIATGVVSPALFPLSQAGIIFILVFFMLWEGDRMARRWEHLVRGSRWRFSDDSIEEAASRISRYLRAQLLVNLVYGVLVSVPLYAVGLPNWLLWAFLAALLRYVPYVGVWIAAAFSILLGAAVFPGWMRPMVVAAAFIIAELLVAGVIEPLVVGKSTGVSPLGVMLSTLFWAWLWGPAGLILAMPLTVTLVVLGQEIPGLSGIAMILSDEPLHPAENPSKRRRPLRPPPMEWVR
jgi:predicted PurR-regulated permease PerM